MTKTPRSISTACRSRRSKATSRITRSSRSTTWPRQRSSPARTCWPFTAIKRAEGNTSTSAFRGWKKFKQPNKLLSHAMRCDEALVHANAEADVFRNRDRAVGVELQGSAADAVGQRALRHVELDELRPVERADQVQAVGGQ